MDAKQYNDFVDRLSDGLYRFILKSIRNKHTAEDIVQEAFERLWKNRNSIELAKVKSFLFTTAYHIMIDGIRKDSKQVNLDTDSYHQEPSHSEQYSDLHELLHQAIQHLPEIQRSVVLLRDYEGYSYQEIATITKISLAQVKVSIYRARVFLKNYIGSIDILA